MNPKSGLNGCNRLHSHEDTTPKSKTSKIVDTAKNLQDFHAALHKLHQAKERIIEDGLLNHDDLNQILKDQFNLV